jgi:hypothetical protein
MSELTERPVEVNVGHDLLRCPCCQRLQEHGRSHICDDFYVCADCGCEWDEAERITDPFTNLRAQKRQDLDDAAVPPNAISTARSAE